MEGDVVDGVVLDGVVFDGVVFDLFHTLIDPEVHRPAGFDYRELIAAELAIDPDAFRTAWDATYTERETTPIDLVDLAARVAGELRGQRFPVELGHDQRTRFDHWFGVAKDEAVLGPPAVLVDLLAGLAGRIRLGILSNCYEREVRRWPDSPYAELVDAFIGSCFVGVMKPDPEAYRIVLDRLGLDAARTVFVGNGGGDELAGARRAGFGAVVHLNAIDRSADLIPEVEQRRRAATADHSVDELEALGPVLERLLDG